ncbi:MAG: FTR1 family iron permease [Propioniciclava sp.]|uniref:FTR1 family protein n=1 Tax=Propioniciclava sp. TaxID=2038686 RepID=UPI0039E55A41
MRRIVMGIGALWLALSLAISATPAAAEDPWQGVAGTVTSLIEQVPGQYAAGDAKAVETTLRKAYYEHYQAQGLEDQVKHRLGAERSAAFSKAVVELRNMTRDGAAQAEVEAATTALTARLAADMRDLAAVPEVNDRWNRVAQSIIEAAENALRLYESGSSGQAFKEATRAYLQHYEADGLEKATLSYLSSGRVAQVEGEFRDIRVGVRDGWPAEEVRGHVEKLSQMVTEDAAKLDGLGASESVGWSGFVAAFLILVREGVEALLVVAAVITYVVKTGRRDQLKGVYLGIGAAIAVSVGLAVAFNSLTSSADLGLTQELIEGVVGVLAAALLIYVSNWILSKSEGDNWHRFINSAIDKRAESGGQWALFTVVFLAVAREGFETILFFIPVFGAAQTPGDRLFIWLGMGAAVLLLAVMFVAVRYFGVRLPLRPFFRWMSVLLSVLAITIAGGAAKELQDGMILEVTPIPGLPQVDWLGFYPTVETLTTQAVVTAIVITLMVVQFRRTAAAQTRTTLNEESNERVETP